MGATARSRESLWPPRRDSVLQLATVVGLRKSQPQTDKSAKKVLIDPPSQYLGCGTTYHFRLFTVAACVPYTITRRSPLDPDPDKPPLPRTATTAMIVRRAMEARVKRVACAHLARIYISGLLLRAAKRCCSSQLPRRWSCCVRLTPEARAMPTRLRRTRARADVLSGAKPDEWQQQRCGHAGGHVLPTV